MFTVQELLTFHKDGIACECGIRAYDHWWVPGREQGSIYGGACKQFAPANDNAADDTIETTAQGGKHSKIKTALTLIPPKALLRVGAVLKPAAEKYGIDNWRNIEQRSHLDHALEHIYAYLAGEETGEDDLVNATCRLLFALETK